MTGIEDRDINPVWNLEKSLGVVYLTRNGVNVNCPFRNILCSNLCRYFKITQVACDYNKKTNIVTHVDITVSCANAGRNCDVIVAARVPAGEYIY